MVVLHPALQNSEFWYSDIILKGTEKLPGGFDRDEVDLSTQFTKGIRLKSPISSAAMDTVTDSKMAILLALSGGIGVLHYNYRTVDEQIAEAEKLKRYEAAFVRNPIVLSPTKTVGDVYKIAEQYGFFSIPITEDGTLDTPLVGIVTRRDIRYLKDMSVQLDQIMTPRERLKVAHKRDTLDQTDIRAANSIIRELNLDTLPIVDDDYKLVALVTDSDLRKDAQYPLATKDDNKQLRGLIAIEGGLESARERIHKGHDVGIDGYVIDQGVVYREQFDIARYIKDLFPEKQVVVGNVDSAEMVRAIMREVSKYVDAIKDGVGPGEVCTTHNLGVGRAQGSAVYECAQELQRLKGEFGDMPLIADGDVKSSGDVLKALALGSSSIMGGYLFVGLAESPALMRYNEERDRLEKLYRGMGSPEAMQIRSAERYGMGRQTKIMVPEGKSEWVGYRGSGYDFIPELLASVRQGMHKRGFRTIPELQEHGFVVPLPEKTR